ncbi:MAG: hypothetical protein ACRED8_13640 [Caulobacteraceae bacterium]
MHYSFADVVAGSVAGATALLVVGFFVWFAASKGYGAVKVWGFVLGWWLVILAIIFVLASIWGPHGAMTLQT